MARPVFERHPGRLIPLLFALLPLSALGLSGSPAQFSCTDPEDSKLNGFNRIQCAIDAPGYVAPGGWSQAVAFLLPDPLPADKSLTLKVRMSGYSARPTYCEGLDFAQKGHIVIKPCAGHYPSKTEHAAIGQTGLGWWGYYYSNSNSHRLGLSLSKALEYHQSIDIEAGVTLEGTSYGGTGAILQSLLLKDADPFWQAMTVRVFATIPQTLVVKPETGVYWKDPAVQHAWQGQDWRKADIIARADELKHIYYRVNGSPADTTVVFDLDFFRLFCEAKRIACFGTWHGAGHTPAEPGINLPFAELYSGPDSEIRHDTPLPVFTGSTANHWGARGHYNLGLEWRRGTATADEVVMPIRYRQHASLGLDIPDQPAGATFDLTLRRLWPFRARAGDQVAWSVGDQSGVARVEVEGEVMITGITIQSGAGYLDVRVEG